MKKEKIAFVVQRYGLDVNGGSECECRGMAEHLSKLYTVDVFTSCARRYDPWDNYYEAGVSDINGVNVYRFPVEKVRDGERIAKAQKDMERGVEGAWIEWIEEVGPYCPKLIEKLKKEAASYKVIFFQTYNFYTTVVGMSLGFKNTIIVPTAHDEPNMYRRVYHDMLADANGILYNSIEEKEFLIEKFQTGGKTNRVTCVGLEKPDMSNLELPEQYRKYGDYVIYVGRVTNHKQCKQLQDYFINYKKRHNRNLKLLYVGRVDEGMQITHCEDIIYLGFVSEEEKAQLISNAKFLIMPSLHESLSLVILESMQLGRPVLVNGDCAVLKGQCIRSNAGLYYTNFSEFERCMEFLLTNTECYNQMVQNGIEFVENNYSWEVVVKNINSLIEEIGR